eukprot:4573350-Karenia_brevis.AAC.1
MDGRQTVPTSELTAVVRALLAVEHFGLGVTEVTVWFDSKIVVDGFQKGTTTLQSGRSTDWEEVWDRVEVIQCRGAQSTWKGGSPTLQTSILLPGSNRWATG